MTAPRTTFAPPFVFMDEWQIAAEIGQVWPVLRRIEGWPGWWPSVRSVVPHPANAIGSPPSWEFTFRTRLPYSLIWSAELIQEEPSARVEWQVSGQLSGRGICNIRAVDGGTLVWWDWRVRPQRTWMRLLAPIARPVFSWNHKELMDEGARRWPRSWAPGCSGHR